MECKLDCLVEVVVEIGIPTVARLRVRARDLTDRGKDHVCWQTGLRNYCAASVAPSIWSVELTFP